MRTLSSSCLAGVFVGSLLAASPALAQQPWQGLLDDLAAARLPEPRPALSALRFDQAELLRRFTPEVRSNAKLRARALDLWRDQFAARAATLGARFTSEPDWRPVLAEAAALVDDYLEASQLPRESVAEPAPSDPGTQVIETLDPKTERMTRIRRPVGRRPVLFAPEKDEKKEKAPERGLTPRVPAAD
jgi:hypothetical protein